MFQEKKVANNVDRSSIRTRIVDVDVAIRVVVPKRRLIRK